MSVKLCSGGVGSVELRRLWSVPFRSVGFWRFSFVGFSWVELGRLWTVMFSSVSLG